MANLMGAPERCVDPTHRSYSSDRTFDGCQYRWHAEYELGLAWKPGMRVIVGFVVDAAIMAALADEPPLDIEHALHERVNSEAPHLTVQDRDIEKATRLFELWEREVRPTYPAVHTLAGEVHVDIAGVTHHFHPDIVFVDGSVVDVKTSEKRLADRRAQEDVQLTTYAYGLHHALGIPLPISVGLDGLIYANAPADVVMEARALGNPVPGKPWYDRQRSIRDADTLRSLEDDVRRRESARRFAITTGLYHTNGRVRARECDDCPALAVCPSWQGFDITKGVIVGSTG
jgi:hypothetical protein